MFPGHHQQQQQLLQAAMLNPFLANSAAAGERLRWGGGCLLQANSSRLQPVTCPSRQSHVSQQQAFGSVLCRSSLGCAASCPPRRQPQHACARELPANMLILIHAGNSNMLLAYLMAASNPAMDPGLMHALLFQSAAAQAAQQAQSQNAGTQSQAPNQALLQLQQLGMLGAGMGGAMGRGLPGLHHLAVSFQPSLA